VGSDTLMDVETTKKNCAHYAKSHRKAIDVLRKANGKDNYKKIAENLGIPETKVSSLLSSARKFGLARKDHGLYKKVPGILQYMPSVGPRKTSLKSVSEIVQKVSKKRISKPKQQNSLMTKTQTEEKMATAYMWLYTTENLLRNLIRDVLSKEQNWWNNRVNPNIRKEVKEAQDKYPYDAAKRKDELEYTHLGQLKEIITAKNNWSLFLPFLNESDKNSFIATVEKAIPSRNSIAHCTPLSGEDLKVVEVRFKDILKMLK